MSSERYFPFHEFGLSGNPFRTLTDEEWVAVAILPDSIRGVLRDNLVHLQLMGEKGRGKTTTLLALTSLFAEEGYQVKYEYIPVGHSIVKSNLGQLEIFVVDEAQRLDRANRNSIISAAEKGVRIVYSSHIDLSSCFNRRQLPLSVVSLDDQVRDHLANILEKRLEFFRKDNGLAIRFSDTAIDHLWRLYSSDFRSTERHLFEFFQQMTFGGEITGDRLQLAALRVNQNNKTIIDGGS